MMKLEPCRAAKKESSKRQHRYNAAARAFTYLFFYSKWIIFLMKINGTIKVGLWEM